jgi:hypothetical protein
MKIIAEKYVCLNIIHINYYIKSTTILIHQILLIAISVIVIKTNLRYEVERYPCLVIGGYF